MSAARQSPTTLAQPKQSSVPDLPPAALDLASRLFDLARQGSSDELSQYITAGIPVNLTNHAGDTFMMLSAYHGHADTVQLLLDRGADPNVLNDRGQSPIAGAVFKGYQDVVQILAKGGADTTLGHPSAQDAARLFRRTELFGLLAISQDGDIEKR